jgi:hypothetical protein
MSYELMSYELGIEDEDDFFPVPSPSICLGRCTRRKAAVSTDLRLLEWVVLLERLCLAECRFDQRPS